MKNKLYFFGCCLLFNLTSCYKDIGEHINVQIPVPAFSALSQDANVDIILSQGSFTSVDFEGSDVVFGDLEFDVIHDELVITQLGHYAYSHHSTIYIMVPDLVSIENTGSGDIFGDNEFRFKGDVDLSLLSSGNIDLDIDALELNSLIRGSGDLRLRGFADVHEIEHDGYGSLYGFALQTKRTRISQFSSGNSEIQVRNNLIVRLRGSGNIYFIGNPFVDYSVLGSGRLIDSN